MKSLGKIAVSAGLALGMALGGAVAANAATTYTLTYSSHEACLQGRAHMTGLGYATTPCKVVQLAPNGKSAFTYTKY